MKIYKVFKNGIETNRWDSATGDHNYYEPSFGLPERPELALNEETGEMEPTGVILPAEYTIEIEDITAQIEQENINAEAKKFLGDSDWKVIRHQDQKALGIATSLTDEEFMALLNERQLQRQRVV
jgi:hypothetical protein